MRILLVQHVRENTDSYPLGLGYVAGTLIEEGHQVDFLDLAFAANPDSTLAKEITEFQPQALGFTLWTSQYPEFVRLLSQCDEARGLTVVAGGPHASALSERVLSDGLVDIVVRGEGEVIAPPLFRALVREDDLSLIRGIAYLDSQGNHVQTEEANCVEDLDNLPQLPYDLLQIQRYGGEIHGFPAVNIQTSRGCPHRCVFCYRGPTSKKTARFRSVQNTFEEISNLHCSYGFKGFNFQDDILTLRQDRILELCEMIISSRHKLFWTCETRVDAVDYQLLSRMKKAGCVCIHFGVESGSQFIIDKLQKDTTKEQARKALRDCQKLRIATHAFFILGTPWDTDETIQETIDFAKELKSTVTVFFKATPYPGTKLREIFIEHGLPVTEDNREYRHFTEGEYLGRAKKDGPQMTTSDVEDTCIRATRVILRSQLADIRSYPRLVREYCNLYGPLDTFRRVVRRLPLVTKKHHKLTQAVPARKSRPGG